MKQINVKYKYLLGSIYKFLKKILKINISEIIEIAKLDAKGPEPIKKRGVNTNKISDKVKL